MRVVEVLQALPSVGKSKAQEIMTDIGIAPTRRLRTLCERQRDALLKKFAAE